MFYFKTLFYALLMRTLKFTSKFIPQRQPFIYTGENSSLDLVQFIIHRRTQHVLIVTDAVLNKLGIADTICDLLRESQVQVTIFDGVTPDPTDVVVEKGISAARDASCDLVLAIGGGSSIDAAKMIAALANSSQTIQQVAGLLRVRRLGLPLCVIPSTAGTGSEVTMAAVITDTVRQAKSLVVSPKITAVAAALDPVIMQGMPAKITADTAFDALTHAIEAYLSNYANEQTDQYAIAAIRIIFEHLPVCYRDGSNLDARNALALASCYAGLAFNQTNVGYVHAISHQIGAKYHAPHGFTNAVVLPYVLNCYVDACQERMAELSVGINSAKHHTSPKEAALSFIDAVKHLQSEVGIPNTLDCIIADDIPSLAKAALKEAHYFYPVPTYINQQQCEKLIQKMC